MRKIDVYIQSLLLFFSVLSFVLMLTISDDYHVVLFLAILFGLGIWQLISAILNTVLELRLNTMLSPELAVYWLAVLSFITSCIALIYVELNILYGILPQLISIYYVLINVKRIQNTRTFLQL